jgi:thiol-disulfide isomerase/thioredoxin
MKTIQSTKFLITVIFCIIYLTIYGQNKISRKKNVKYIRLGQYHQNQTNISVKDYVFKDTLNHRVRLSRFKGKFVFVDIWYSGCGACISANRALRSVHEKLKHENIVFLSISIDAEKRKWMASITENTKPSAFDPWAGKYCPASGTVLLYTGGTGFNNDFIRTYDPDNFYPKLLLFDRFGRLITDHPPRPDGIPDDQPEKLVGFLLNYLKSKS